MNMKFNINNKPEEFEIRPDATLLNVLRDNGFSEVKCGCSEGECGACIVSIDEKPVNSCQVFAMSVGSKKIKTVKGIGTLHTPHLIQKIFASTGADQCGFCSPGMVLSAYSLLKENPNPTDKEIAEALDGNLCRCTGYVKIIEAIRRTAQIMNENLTSRE